MIIVLDTETTGLPQNYKAPVTDTENWPRLVQLAYRTYSNDGAELDNTSYIISPNGFDIPDDAAKLHGITTQKALDEGISLETTLAALGYEISRADYIVSHNIAYDEKIIGAEYFRTGHANPLEGKKTICTMLASVDYCAIPGPRGNKWPKLSELYQVLFAENLEGEHDAEVDCEAAARCFWELVEKGVIVLDTQPVPVDEMFPPAQTTYTTEEFKALEAEIADNQRIADEETPAYTTQMTDEEAVNFLAGWDDRDPEDLYSAGEIQAELLASYATLDKTRVALHKAAGVLELAERELDDRNFQARKSDEYKALKNDPLRADFLRDVNGAALSVVIAANDVMAERKLDFERAQTLVERARALLRVAELEAGTRVER